jgi:hypothetical protein
MIKAVAAILVMGAILLTVYLGLNKNCLMPKEMCGFFPGCMVYDPCECYLSRDCLPCDLASFCTKRVVD